MTTDEVIQKSAYMYKVLNGRFRCMQGYIVRYPQRRDVFFARGTKKYYTVSERPNEIHCGNLWMMERDDDFARKAFVKSYRETRDDLMNEIARLYDLMYIVEEEEL